MEWCDGVMSCEAKLWDLVVKTSNYLHIKCNCANWDRAQASQCKSSQQAIPNLVNSTTWSRPPCGSMTPKIIGPEYTIVHWPYVNRMVCNIPLFFFSFRGPLTDWFRQTLFYSHWSTQTECSTHSRSNQTPTKLSAPLYTCTDSLYVHVLHMKTCPCCLQSTNKHVNLISDENILVVVFVLVYMPWSTCCC